jgi:hypothetical protein
MPRRGHPPIFETPEQLEDAIDEYFKTTGVKPVLSEIDGIPVVVTDPKGRPVFRTVPPTTTGLALHLGFISRLSLYDQAKRKDQPVAFSNAIKRAISHIESYHEANLTLGTGGVSVGSMFWLKNHQWSDRPGEKGPDDNNPPMRIHISGKPDPADLDTLANDNLEISRGKS